MVHVNVLLKLHASPMHIFFFFCFFFPFFAAPLRVPPGANSPLCPPPPRYATGPKYPIENLAPNCRGFDPNLVVEDSSAVEHLGWRRQHGDAVARVLSIEWSAVVLSVLSCNRVTANCLLFWCLIAYCIYLHMLAYLFSFLYQAILNEPVSLQARSDSWPQWRILNSWK